MGLAGRYLMPAPCPLQLVTRVRKRKNLGFPNSIEVTWGGGRKEFFTSFVSREEAYKLVLGAWSQAAPELAVAQMVSAKATHGKGARHGGMAARCFAVAVSGASILLPKSLVGSSAPENPWCFASMYAGAWLLSPVWTGTCPGGRLCRGAAGGSPVWVGAACSALRTRALCGAVPPR